MRRLVAVFVTCFFVFSGLVFASPALAVEGQAADVFAARVIAKSSGARVLVTGLLDEFSTTYVNPDGTLTNDSYGSAIRVRDDRMSSGWRDLDYDLVFQADGSVSPKSGLFSLFISGGGTASQVASSGVVRVTSSDGSLLGFSWLGALPKPVLVGPKATYSEVLPGVDLVIEATPSGFEQFFILKVKPSADVLSALVLPLKTKKVSVVENSDGSFSFENSANDEVASLPTPRVWDSSFEPKSGSAVEGELNANLNVASNTLELGGLAAFLDNPDLVYPVIVDPALTLNPLSDVYVRDDSSTSFWSSNELLVGTYDGGTTRARSYLRFRNTQWAGKQITAATLKIYETWSYSCNSRSVYLYPVVKKAVGSWSWSNQPTISTSVSDSVSTAKGYSSSCSAGWVSINAKDVTSYLASRTDVEGSISTFALRASETDSYGWKRFTSANGTNKPSLSVTYNNIPTQPSIVSVSPSQYVNGVQYVTSLMPRFTVLGSDGDKDPLTYYLGLYADATATTPYQALCSVYVSDPGPGWCAPTYYMSDNTTYYVRAFARDSRVASTPEVTSPISELMVIRTANTVPSAPTISCPGFSNGSNSSTIPIAPVNCVVNVSNPAGSRPAENLLVSVNSVAPVTIPTTAGVLSYNVSLPTGQRGHTIQATSVSVEGLKSSGTTYSVSFGDAGVYSPTTVTKTSSTVKVSAFVKPSWIPLSEAFIEWSTVDGSIQGTKHIALGQLQNFGGLQGLFDYQWNAREVFEKPGVTELADGGAVAISAKVCFSFQTLGMSEVKCTPSDISLLVVPHAFNSVNPTASAGSGTVALLTGELQLSVSDASQSLPEGALSISRQYLSYDGPQNSSQAVFGQGWRASFSGIDSGAATLVVADTTATQRLITLSDANGETLVYKVPSALSGNSPTGTYLPADPSTLEAQATLSVVEATSKTLQLVEADGRKTVWNEATSNGKTLWLIHTITEATGQLTNSYTYDSNLRVTRILGPAPSGVSCNNNSENAGCKALYISYATATNTITGDFAGQVKSIDFKAYDPSTSSMQRKTVATYKYDVAGHLTSVTDPRSNITTNYSYTVNALTQVKLLTAISQSTGLAGTYFMYDSQARLLHVSLGKADGSPGKDVVSTFVYNYQNGQNILPATTANLWDQTVYPKNVAAVFGSNAPAEISEATDNLASITANSLKFGTYYFSNSDGVTVNTATFGKSAWRYTYTKFDEQYRPLAVFDENAIDQIINLNSQGLLNNYNIYRFATVNKYAPAVKVGETQVDGGQLIETWEPTKPVQVGNSVVEMRLHTIINYNENEPTPLLGPGLNIHYGLETSRDITLADAESSNWNATTSNTGETFVARTVLQYDPINTSLPRLHETSGWLQQQPTITQNLDEDGIVVSETKKVFDPLGRTLKTINSPTSNDLLSETSTYYTATANTAIPSCGLKPAWSGLVCVTGSSDGLGRQKPDQQITAYDYYLRPTAVVDTIKYVSGANTFTGSKTTNTSYISTGAAFGSVATTQTKSKNGTAAEVSGTLNTTTYDSLTGLVISKTAGSSTISYTYDAWGRKLTLTNKPDPVTTDTTTWSYMPAGLIGAGQVSSVTSTKSSYFYGYGGQGETSNQPTSLNVSGVGTYTATYNNSGQLQEQTAPGGISQKFEYDTAGRIKTMSYLGTVDNAGVSVTVNWMDFTRSYDAQNRVAIETTPGVFPGLQNDTIYNYGYDAKSRLTNVDQVDNLTCVNRKYVFDASGNRLSKTTKLKASTGSVCDANSTDELTEVESLTYNNYSQLTNTGYVYDVFGRATTVPSLHTANQAGNVTFAYSPEDRILSQTQGSTKTDYTYDVLGRRYQDKVGSIVKTVRHYTDETDNPSWVTGTGTAAAQTDIFTTALASNLNATRKVNGTTTTTYLNIGNLHGDTITSLQLPSTGYVAGPNELNVFDEYGVQQTLNPEDRPDGVSPQTNPSTLFILNYGSLGQPQRETTDTGIQFMGARGYNPITGQFLSPDPIQGGNETPYNYPNDPINLTDLTGLASKALELSNLIMGVGFDLITIGLCIAFPAACILTSLAIGVIGGGLSAYFESREAGSSQNTTINHVIEGAVFGGISSGFGGIASKASKYLAKPISRAANLFKDKKHRQNAKNVLSWASEYGVGKLVEYSMGELFRAVRNQSLARQSSKANACFP